jgi:undecaprenyl-phosphate 4-deoxy-4-formamido-L-arabinose transferase
MKVSVVVPVYNSQETLDVLVSGLVVVLAQQYVAFEIILVNDGSSDRSWDLIKQLSQKYGFIHGIDMMRNYGQHNALLAGIRAANGDVVVTMDDDLQNPAEELPKLVEMLFRGYDVVYGTPKKAEHDPLRNLASNLTKLMLQSSMGADNARSISPFRAFKVEIREAFANYRNPSVNLDVLLTWGTRKFTYVPVEHKARQVGQSSYTIGKLINHALNMVTGFSTAPLRFASITGIAFTLLGATLLLYVIGRFLIQGVAVPGFVFLASTILLFSGAQMFALGIMGEYLARIFVRNMDRPVYTVREHIDTTNLHLNKAGFAGLSSPSLIGHNDNRK